MTEQEFIDSMSKTLSELRSQRVQQDEQARIALIFMREFRPTLLRLLKECKLMDKFCLMKTEILDEHNDFDIRSCMDDELINIAADKGFIYMQEHSTPDFLDFRKAQNSVEY